MKQILTIILILLAFGSTPAQVTYKHLKGKWRTCNLNDIYINSDTIIFYQDVKPNHSTNVCCSQIQWTINRKSLEIYELNTCVEPSLGSVIYANEKIRIKNSDYGQLLELFRNSNLIDKFKILNIDLGENSVNGTTSDIRTMELLRYDSLGDQKLVKYIFNLIDKNESISPSALTSVNKTAVKELMSKEAELPSLVVNGIPFNDYEILQYILLVECIDIKFIHGRELTETFKESTRNGVVLIDVSSKAFEKAKSEYDR